MRSTFIRNASARDKRITYTPMFSKTFIEKSPVRTVPDGGTDLLKAERLKAFWDLMSYEDHYKEKKSIRVRVKAINSCSNSLLKELGSLTESIETDRRFIKDIESIMKIQHKKKVKKSLINHIGLSCLEFWTCFQRENKLFCGQIIVNQSSFKSKIKLYSYSSSQFKTLKNDPDLAFKDIIKDQASVISHFTNNYLSNISVDFEESFKEKQIQPYKEEKVLSECFDESCFIASHKLVVSHEEVSVSLYENHSIHETMLQVTYKNKTYNILSSDYKEDFDLLLSLQFSSSIQKATFFKSLEFSSFIRSLIKSLE